MVVLGGAECLEPGPKVTHSEEKQARPASCDHGRSTAVSPNGKNRTSERGDSRSPRSEHHPESPTCTQGLGHCSEPIWLSGPMKEVLVTILLSAQCPLWK